MAEDAEPSSPLIAKQNRRVAVPGRGTAIVLALTISVGALVLVAVLSVLGITLLVAQNNTLQLLAINGRLSVASIEQRIDALLRPAENQLAYIADRMTAHPGLEADLTRTIDILTGAQSATPQIASVAFVKADGEITAVERDEGLIYRDFLAQDEMIQMLLKAARASKDPAWRPVIWRSPFNTPLLNYHYPVYGPGGLVGVLVALIPAEVLSDMLAANDAALASADPDSEDVVASSYILSGQYTVLAHPDMKPEKLGLSESKPLPALAEFPDPIMRGIWRDRREESQFFDDTTSNRGHMTRTDRVRYLFVYNELRGYGDEPWTVGIYIRMRDAVAEMVKLAVAGAVGLIILGLAIATTIYIGRKIARPVQRLAVAADRVRDLNLAAISELPGSRIRELNDAAAAFNAMVNGLRWFETYVPRPLVRRLLGHGAEATASEERQVTVMFTDIAGFTPLSEGMPAQELAAYLNHHFSIVTDCIDQHGGTVDKFMGDAVMAFWGAPDEQTDHADRACRAALAIRDAIVADNPGLERHGQPVIRMRVGIHTGPVVVGNIGSQSRINYTIVGDTVNVGQRLEALCKEMAGPDDSCAILLSGDTRMALVSDLSPDYLGEREIRGRDEPVSVYKL